MTDFLKTRAAQLADYSTAYYEGRPKISDQQFDTLLAEYIEHGGTEQVGHGFHVTDRKVRHAQTMGSLKKIQHDIPALTTWIENTGADTFSVSPKFDGLAVAVTVENGEAVLVATRGDGTIGENVTDTARHIPDIAQLTEDGTYYGEVMLPREHLEAANALRDEREAPMTQLRNAAAGILRREARPKGNDTADTLKARQKRVQGSAALLVFANHNSGAYVRTYTRSQLLENLEQIIASYEPQRTAYPVADDKHVFIDGVVFKVEDTETRERMGWSSGSPRWARAYKYEDLAHTSTVTGIEWGAPGKIGRITPVLTYEGIQIDGGTYTRATAHNLSQFRALDPRAGDQVTIIKSGEVIPYIVNIEHTGDGDPLPVPETCPRCGAPTAVDGEFLVCTADRVECDPAAALTLIITALGIKGIQYAVVKPVYDAHLSDETDMHDALTRLLALDDGVIANTRAVTVKDGVERSRVLGKAMEQKFKNSITHALTEAPLAAWIYGLNVDRVGNTVSQALVDTYGSLDGIIEAIDDPSKYREVQHLKGVNWKAIVAGRQRFVRLREWLTDNGITPRVPEHVEVDTSSEWNGKKVALTGTLPVPRADAVAWLEAHGATISSGFDVLIDAGDGSSAKSKKAREKGKTVVTGAEFMEQYGE